MRKTILTAAALAMIVAPVMAESCDLEILFVDGALTRGSMVCNPAWLDRPASREAAAVAARDCNGLGEKKLFKNMMGGALAFGRKVRKMGRDRACKSLDEDMTKLDVAMGADTGGL